MTTKGNIMTDDRATETTQRRYDRQAAVYDLMDLPTELLVFRKLRRKLWTEVTGKFVLEVGVGTGKNLPYHPEDPRIVALDLSPRMLRRAVERARPMGRKVDFLVADAQHLPFREGAFDAVVATFVFCSVPDPVAGLHEVRRVVGDTGRVHLLEHVRATNLLVGRLMDLLNPVTARLTGANINRDTIANVGEADITVDTVGTYGLGLIKLLHGSVQQRHELSREASEHRAASGSRPRG